MVAGLLITLYYMVRVQFDSIEWLGLHGIGMEPWLDIQSTSAGVWGIPVGFLVIVTVSLLTPPPPPETQRLVEALRYPAP
jgi:cation/acetate symporter